MTRRIRRRNNEKISDQIKSNGKDESEHKLILSGNFASVISTGSTLLDLAISGGVIRGGGIPGGVIVEIFGPPSIGKTSFLCEVAGRAQDRKGEVKFFDPEARLSTAFAKIYGYEIDQEAIHYPDTPADIFGPIRKWELRDEKRINLVGVDSTAAISSDLEMEDKKDEYSRRAKLFSQELRKSCRIIAKKNLIVLASNQLRGNIDAGPFSEKFSTPGGEAWKFYSSLRLKAQPLGKIKKKIKFKGKEIEKVIGVKSLVTVVKSSIWKPFRTAEINILFDYGIDDIRVNLQWMKTTLGTTSYTIDGKVQLNKSMDRAIAIVEQEGMEKDLRENVIDLWEEIEKNFVINRKRKKRF